MRYLYGPAVEKMTGTEKQAENDQADNGQGQTERAGQPVQGVEGGDSQPKQRERRARSQEERRRQEGGRRRDGGRDWERDGGYYRDHRRYGDYPQTRSYDRGYRDQYGDYERRYRDSGYFDDHYYDESDYHRPLSYDNRSRGSRPLYRARSLPQRDFQSYQNDYYDINPTAYSRRPYSNLGDYGGYEHGINRYMGNEAYSER